MDGQESAHGLVRGLANAAMVTRWLTQTRLVRLQVAVATGCKDTELLNKIKFGDSLGADDIRQVSGVVRCCAISCLRPSLCLLPVG